MRLSSSLVAVLVAVSAALVAVPASATPTCQGKVATIVGTDGDDPSMEGTDGDDVVWLGAGNDVFLGNAGDDLVCGGPGSDQLLGDNGDDILLGEDGGDLLDGGDGSDRLSGGAGRDVLAFDGVGSDVLLGGPNGDGLHLWGGVTNSWVPDVGPTIDLPRKTITAGPVRATVAGFEYFYATELSDTFLGTDGPEEFHGFGGPDLLRMGGGNDYVDAIDSTVYAGRGADNVHVDGNSVVDLGPGPDQVQFTGRIRAFGGAETDMFYGPETARGSIDGGTGGDTLAFHNQYGLRVDLAQGSAIWEGGDLRLSRLSQVIGTSHRDILLGSDLDESFNGGAGADVLGGRGGADFLSGDADRDVAYGGPGTDWCRAEVARGCERRT